MTDETVSYPESLQRAARASARGAQEAARRARREPSRHLGATTPAGRVALFLDAREGMTGVDQEEIMTVGSHVSAHESVTLLASDLRALLSAIPTDEEINDATLALAKHAFPGGFQGAELSFEDWWNLVLPESTREAYRVQARVALGARHRVRMGGAS